MRKKLVAVLLTMAFLASMVGCSSSDTSSDTSSDSSTDTSTEADSDDSDVATSDVTLTIAMCGDGTTKEVLDELLAGFTAETGIAVESIYVASSWGEFTTKVQTMVAGGEKIDNCILAVEAIPDFFEMGLVQPIDDWIAENPDIANAILDDTNPLHQASFMDDEGNMYAFPFSSNNVVMHFNMERLEAAGLDLPDSDWTTEDFMAYCEALTYEEDGVQYYAFGLPYTEWFCSEAWLFNNGAAFFNEDSTVCTMNSPEAVEMFEFLQDLVFEYGYAPTPEESYSTIEQLISGQVAMGSWGRWPTANYLASDFEAVGVQKLPSMSTYQEIFGVDGIFTLATTEYPEEAMQLAAYMCSATFISEYLSAGNIPCLETVAIESVSSLGFPENYEVFYEELMADDVKQTSTPLEYDAITVLYNTAMSEIFVNGSDCQTILDALTDDINALLD